MVRADLCVIPVAMRKHRTRSSQIPGSLRAPE